ncbi:Ribonuclease [Bacillus rhizoplanae]|uniref:Ribonuclease n=1 Tax=Bacillus rhizoplanae TaxID=2880966 RepID=A0ABN7ZXG5_9BACI|nr:EndoU domain-containing protein [Bacillus rhizoplanae]CAG9611989.1 Ribonuclease [Bacillus rhizoplanae]
MSLNMYLGEVRTQSQSMNAFCVATIQGMEQAINSIDAFVGDAVLQGQTYDSAKTFFAQTFRPLAQGIIYLCEELIRQNNAFPNDFQSQVASTDVIEQEILEQIREIERTKAGIEVISSTLPGMQVMVNIFDAMKRKLQEKLEHLHEFNYTSSSNYDTALQLAASIATGLAEVQSGKGFNAASGTFSVQELNMDWTAPIQEIIENKAREAEKLKTEMSDSNSEKSLLEKIGDGIWDGAGQAVGDIVEGFKSLDDTVTKENIKYAIGHPIETVSTMWNALSDSFINDVINGDAESCTRWITYNFMGLGLGWMGDKGASKVSTLVKGTNFTKVTEITAPRLHQTFTSLTNDLNIENRLAFADTNGLNLRSFDYSTFNEVKDTFLFFDKYKSHPNSIYKNNGTVEHIFHGNINSKGSAGGYHHVSMMGEGEILNITKQPNKYGVYEAKVTVNGVVKVPTSTFFPDEWSRVEVLQAIKEAYNNKVYTGRKNSYIGTTSNGMKITMFIDSNGRIISAFPKY